MSSNGGILTGQLSTGAGGMCRLGGAVSGATTNTLYVHSQLTSGSNGLIIGALSNGNESYQANSLLLNSNITSTVELNRANTFGGVTRLNGNGTSVNNQWLVVGNDSALSTGT